MNDLVKTEPNYVDRYRVGPADPYKQFAEEGGPGVIGKLLTCKKGEWEIGADGDPVPAGRRYLILVPTMARGWLKWAGGVVIDARVGLVADNFFVPHRYTLGDVNEDMWEKVDGQPRDPWAKVYRVQLVDLSPPHGDLTFSSGSYGAALALKEVCRSYASERPTPDAQPVVELTTKARQSKSYGKLVGPWFTVHGWATEEDVRAGRKAGAAKAVPKRKAAAPVTPADWGKEQQ